MSDMAWLEAEPEANWLVSSDNESGRRWFGRTVQTVRKDLGLSVAELAARAGLADGTIRAIERGGRAPSEASGLRIIAELFSDAQWSKNYFGPGLHALRDPVSESSVFVEFGAKERGDNRRWSRERMVEQVPRYGEDELRRKLEEHLLENPEKLQELKHSLSEMGDLIKAYAAHLKEPIDDANLGKVIRRLPAITNLQADYLDKLLWIWGRINAGRAGTKVIGDVKKIEMILDTFLSEDELEGSSKKLN